jgi:hypothetical protein
VSEGEETREREFLFEGVLGVLFLFELSFSLEVELESETTPSSSDSTERREMSDD